MTIDIPHRLSWYGACNFTYREIHRIEWIPDTKEGFNVKRVQKNRVSSILISVLLFSGLLLAQGTQITAPKNNYALGDDVRLGREAANEVSRQMPLLPENGDVDSYVERVGARLAESLSAQS